MLVADDGSPDGTGEIADELAAADPPVHVLHRTGKAGLGAAYIAGFRWALDDGYDVLVEMDADGSHAPEQLPRLLTALRDADLVLGSRWVPGGRSATGRSTGRSSPRRQHVRAAAAAVPVRDVTGGYRAFRRQVLEELALDEVASQGYCFQVDLAWALAVRVPGPRGADHVHRARDRPEQDEPGHRGRGAVAGDRLGADLAQPQRPGPGPGGPAVGRRAVPILLGIVLYAAVEIAAVVAVASWIGIGWTLLLLLGLSLVGLVLLRREGSRAWRSFQLGGRRGPAAGPRGARRHARAARRGAHRAARVRDRRAGAAVPAAVLPPAARPGARRLGADPGPGDRAAGQLDPRAGARCRRAATAPSRPRPDGSSRARSSRRATHDPHTVRSSYPGVILITDSTRPAIRFGSRASVCLSGNARRRGCGDRGAPRAARPGPPRGRRPCAAPSACPSACAPAWPSSTPAPRRR